MDDKKKEKTGWINEVREKVNSSCLMDHWSNPCTTIFKVPQHIRQLDDKAYDPVVASFGPFHHERFDNSYWGPTMQDHKWRCVRYFLSCHGSRESQLLHRCLSELKEQDSKVRSCYSQEFSTLDAQNMALIMLLDGCFIIYLMLKMKESTDQAREGEVVLNIEGKKKLPEYPTVAGLFTLDLVVHDLLKLENQIPFFIIELLFNHLNPCEDRNIGLVKLALRLFKDIHPKKSKSFMERPPSEYHHLLHLFYSSRIPSKLEKGEPATESKMSEGKKVDMKSECKKAEAISKPEWIPSATELDRAGVKFKKNESADGFLNITFGQRRMKITPLLCLLKLYLIFRSGRMEIPPLRIYDYTGPLFRNLIAFEQCYYNTKMYITIYALFMDCIIDKAEDVRLLHLVGILEHKLSSDQAVAELFNKLGCHIHFVSKKNYLANQIERVNKFYDSSWHKWLAALRRDYLRNPWAIISVLAAMFLLLLTVEQAIFAALSYFHPS
uniref:UPF0481 protein At3g47200-like n=1 Tax=Elaeis guineensis var. tenera TaxID=51953 RepID=A0A6I9QMI3_ELAGV|nr:UPF0481 protein At3g47200-like [Elaeis guineensis]